MYLINFILIIILNLLYYLNLKKISKLIGIFDFPDQKRKKHLRIVPPIGGICIFLSISVFSFLSFVYSDQEVFSDFYFIDNKIDLKSILSFYLCTTLLIFLGIADDKNGIGANIRLLFFAVIYYLAMMFDDQLLLSTIKIKSLDIIIDLEKLGPFFTILCFLVLINALNMFDGINIQTGLFCLIIFTIFFVKGIFANLSMVLIISLIFFIYFNFKDKVFMGNHGVYFISFIITFFIIKNYNSSVNISAEEVYLILYLPILDLLRLFVVRIYKNNNPFIGDRNHIHHYLNQKLNSFLKTSLLTNVIAFTPFLIFTFYKSFNVLIFTTILYFILILILRK
tara:strand:- start:710 stop:1723 length:1014 start_codon:yes stop_codon:yes gene_type:complete